MKKDTMFKAMGDVNPAFLSEFEEMAAEPVKKSKKTMPLVAMACATLLMGAGTGLTALSGGGTMDHVTGVAVYTNTTSDIYYENNDELYFITGEEDRNITSYVTENRYFFHVNLDETGTGTVVAVGGVSENRGFTLWELQQGEVIFVRGNSDQYLPVSGQEFEESLYPQLSWNHHGTDFVAENVSKLVNLESLEGETVAKVDENSYVVEVTSLDAFTEKEVSRYVTHEMTAQLDWADSLSVTEENGAVLVTVYEEETEELYSEAVSVLDATGFDYELVFEVVEETEIEVVEESDEVAELESDVVAEEG